LPTVSLRCSICAIYEFLLSKIICPPQQNTAPLKGDETLKNDRERAD
jgi:hypothetical protein